MMVKLYTVEMVFKKSGTVCIIDMTTHADNSKHVDKESL